MRRSNLKSLIPGAAPLAVALIMSGCATTGSTSSGSAPAGYVDYCNRHPDRPECRSETRLPQDWRRIAAQAQAGANEMPRKT
jgi:predicted transglutaminase-like cysteine proteinase